MQITHRPKLLLSVLVVLFATAHAHAGGEHAASSKQADIRKPGVNSPNGFTRTVQKKGGSGVELAYKVDGTPEVGKPVVVNIQMMSPADAQVTVRAEGGLQVAGKEQVMRSAAGVSAEHQMSVTPLAAGRHYLFVTSTSNGRTSASAIAVQVGKDMPQAKPTGDVKIMPGGERVISMPAQ